MNDSVSEGTVIFSRKKKNESPSIIAEKYLQGDWSFKNAQ